MEGYSMLWLIITAGGAAVLGAAIAYGVMRNRYRSRGEVIASQQATRELYDRENRRTHGQ